MGFSKGLLESKIWTGRGASLLPSSGRPSREHDSHKPQEKAKLGSVKEDGEGRVANREGDEQIVS